MTDRLKGMLTLCNGKIIYGLPYFAMISILSLYLNQQGGFELQRAYNTYGLFVMLSYALPVLGGFLGDKVLDWRHCVVYGSILLSTGFVVMGVYPGLWGLSIFICGIALLKSNISSLLGQFYTKSSSAGADHGFTLFYALMNIGAIAGPMLIGACSYFFGYQWGFIIIGIGLFALTASIIINWRHLPTPEIDYPWRHKPISKHALSWLGFLLLTIFVEQTLTNESWQKGLLLGLTVLLLAYLSQTIYKATPEQRRRFGAFAILVLFCLLFFITELQVGSSLVMFIKAKIYPYIAIPAGSYASLLAFGVSIGALILRPLLTKIEHQPNYVRYQIRSGLALAFTAVSYMIFYLAATAIIQSPLIRLLLVMLGYLLLGLGEVAIAPIMVSSVSVLIPKKQNSTFMGISFLAIGIAGFLAGIIANITTRTPSGGHSLDFTETFLTLIILSLAGLALTVALTPLMKKLLANTK